jgi:hypothetical protein
VLTFSIIQGLDLPREKKKFCFEQVLGTVLFKRSIANHDHLLVENPGTRLKWLLSRALNSKLFFLAVPHMISRKDLAIIKHTDKTKKLLASQPISELLSLVKHWLNVPELRPSNTTRFADYKELQHNKSKVIERILHLDWVKQ